MQSNLLLRLPPHVAAQRNLLLQAVADELGVKVDDITDVRLTSRSIDARQRNIKVQLRLQAYVGEPAPEVSYEAVQYQSVAGAPDVVVVGAGPAGLFAALRLIELGLRPIVLERGKDVHRRRIDVAKISREHLVNPESNYSFGEGGAGAFSDGKLFTRSKKRGNVEKVLRVFCQMGASSDILIDAHPHIGSDRLPAVIERMREQIKACGGEVHFQTRVDALLFDQKGEIIQGVRTQIGEEYLGPVILATGHSARDVYTYLATTSVAIEAKGIAMGVRLEHPSALIDRIQYHNPAGRGRFLPAAEYSFVCQQEGRGVYSFCMCPGGFVVPAATGPEQVVVNGMSASGRNGKWSNSGMVVEVRPEDVTDGLSDIFGACERDVPSPTDPLRVMRLQEAIERMAWMQGGRRQCAPAERMTDFVNHRLSADLPAVSYTPGVVASPLHFWMPAFITRRLEGAFKEWGRMRRGFLTAEATVIAAETRTSAPVRISRQSDTLQSPAFQGLFPCGEGAGYAGGIVSAAIDGERCAEAVAAYLGH